MSYIETLCNAKGCEKVADTCLCENHLNERLEKVYQQGRKDGYEEGFESGQKAVDPKD